VLGILQLGERFLEHRLGDRVVRALIEKQRRLVNSDNPIERLRILWIAALLDQRLAGCTDNEIGELMDVVLERFGIFEPEFPICYHAKKRLLLRGGREH